MLGRTDRRLRHLALLVVLAVFATALSVRLVYWQVGQADDLRRRAADQQDRPSLEFAQRGDITDRRGTLLATTAYRDLLAAYPDLLSADQRAPTARRLAALLGFDGTQTSALVKTFEKGVPYTIVARRLTGEQSQAVREALAGGELAALTLEPQPVRFYPNPGGAPRTTLASQLLGFVTEDGRGSYGIEQFNQAALTGTQGTTASLDGAALPARAGADIALTIDASLQLRVEKELYAVWVADRAKRVSAVVLDPYTGAILAWASVPGYDANAYGRTASTTPGLFVDPLASAIYEPGSVLKMVTVAAALEAGAVEPDTLIEDEGVLHFGPVVIRNADRRGMGPISVREVLAYSRNVATSKIAALLGESTDEAAAELHAMWQRLGLGRPTGVEVANEAGGLMADPQAAGWRPVELANRSFGQGVAITQIQLAAAYAAMVNGGTLVRPHLVAAVDGSATATASAAQVLEPALAETLRELLVSNVSIVPEIARRTHIDGYVVGGKTGTAQYWDVELGNWARNSYNYTFSGFVGGDRPELVIVVRIHEVTPTIQRRHRLLIPEVESYDAFRRIAQGAIDVLDLAPLGGGIDEPNAGGSGEPSPSAAPTTVPPAPPAPGGGGG